MKTIIIALFPLLISITIAVPIKDPHDFDDIIARVNSFKHFAGRHTNLDQRGKRAPLDLERSPLLYDYYSNSPNIYQPRQVLDRLDKDILDHYLALRAIYASGSNEPVKRQFDEIDRDPEEQLSGGLKRNIDEIDRAGFNTLKRNFDEIDRAGFNGLKRTGAYYNEIERPGVSFNSKHSV